MSMSRVSVIIYSCRHCIDCQERIQFTLTDSLQLMRIKPASELLAQNGDIDRVNVVARFDADFCLMAGEMSALIYDLSTAFDGEI